MEGALVLVADQPLLCMSVQFDVIDKRSAHVCIRLEELLDDAEFDLLVTCKSLV